MTTEAGTKTARGEQQPFIMRWEEIKEPGPYIEITTGALFRIPKEAFVNGSIVIKRENREQPGLFAKLSEDPFMPIGELRELARKHDFEVGF